MNVSRPSIDNPLEGNPDIERLRRASRASRAKPELHGDLYSDKRHPFRRLTARIADIVLLGLPATLVVSPLFKGLDSAPVVLFVYPASCLVLTGLLSAVLIAISGTTPGKFVYGIDLSFGGKKLTPGQALQRELHVLMYWLIYSQNFFVLITGERIKHDDLRGFDKNSFDVLHHPWGGFRVALVVGYWALLVYFVFKLIIS